MGRGTENKNKKIKIKTLSIFDVLSKISTNIQRIVLAFRRSETDIWLYIFHTKIWHDNI